MKVTCIQHPANERLVMIRESYMAACEGDACRAALLAFFEYWHNVKCGQRLQALTANQVAEQHGTIGTHDPQLWQWHTEEQLEAGIMIYSRRTIREGIKFLEAKGFLQVGNNPNPAYRFDRTRYFLFLPDRVNEWLQAYAATMPDASGTIAGSSGRIAGSSGKTTGWSRKTAGPSGKTAGTISEKTPKMSSEMSTQTSSRRGLAQAPSSTAPGEGGATTLEVGRSSEMLQPDTTHGQQGSEQPLSPGHLESGSRSSEERLPYQGESPAGSQTSVTEPASDGQTSRPARVPVQPRGGEPSQPAGQAEKPPSDVHVFLKTAGEVFQSTFHEPLHVHYAKDGAIVKRLLKTFTLEVLMAKYRLFVQTTDPYVLQVGHTLGMFALRVNAIRIPAGPGPGLPPGGGGATRPAAAYYHGLDTKDYQAGLTEWGG